MNIVDKAKSYASVMHDGIYRKDHKTPFIEHPKAVAAKLSKYCDPTPDMVASAWLHDVVEDCRIDGKRIPIRDIKELFNEKIGNMVCMLTRAEGIKKEEYYKLLASCSVEVLFIKYCDRLSNLEDTLKLDMSSKENRDFASYYMQDSINMMYILPYYEVHYEIRLHILEHINKLMKLVLLKGHK